MDDHHRADPVRLVFVCLGNICRSPTAEAVMATRVEQAGLSNLIEVDSAGTGDWHVGDTPDERATEEAIRRGVAMRSRARQFHVGDFAYFDLVLAMDSHNFTDLAEIAPDDQARSKLHMLRWFDPASAVQLDARDQLDVPDPYFGGRDGFARVFDLIDAACVGLLAHVRAMLLESSGNTVVATRGPSRGTATPPGPDSS